MSVINTNYLSLVAQNNLQKSQSALGTAIERLSSGLRINSAKDDAAGQAIANRMGSQINGLNQASRNANDGISAAQTTEGALNQINDNLQRIRVLTVQASNGTNSGEDLNSIQNEIGQRLEEINRISRETEFNGVKVLASDDTLKIQVGANDGQVIEINLQEINASSLNLSNFNVTNASLDTSKLSTSPITETVAEVAASKSVTELTFADSNAAGALKLVTDLDDADSLYVQDGSGNNYAATYNSATNTISYDSSVTVDLSASAAGVVDANELYDGDQIVSVGDVGGFTDTSAAPSLTVYGEGGGNNYYVSNDGGTTFFTAAIDFDTGVVTWDSSEDFDGAATAEKGVGAANIEDVTAAPLAEVVNFDSGTPAVTIDTSSLSADAVGDDPEVYSNEDGGYVVKGEVDGQTVYYSATVNTGTGAVTLGDQLNADPLASIDDALKTVDALRSDLGAIQNRFESAITNLQTTSNNLAAAQSRIQDADYSVEVANMTRAQILQQAGTSVLAQANQIPQGVLSLLR